MLDGSFSGMLHNPAREHRVTAWKTTPICYIAGWIAPILPAFLCICQIVSKSVREGFVKAVCGFVLAEGPNRDQYFLQSLLLSQGHRSVFRAEAIKHKYIPLWSCSGFGRHQVFWVKCSILFSTLLNSSLWGWCASPWSTPWRCHIWQHTKPKRPWPVPTQPFLSTQSSLIWWAGQYCIAESIISCFSCWLRARTR